MQAGQRYTFCYSVHIVFAYFVGNCAAHCMYIYTYISLPVYCSAPAAFIPHFLLPPSSSCMVQAHLLAVSYQRLVSVGELASRVHHGRIAGEYQCGDEAVSALCVQSFCHRAVLMIQCVY